MLRLILARHAEAEIDSETKNLTPRGRRQANALGKAIKRFLEPERPFLLSSPVARASQTSLRISQAFKGHMFDKPLQTVCVSNLSDIDALSKDVLMPDSHYGFAQGAGKHIPDEAQAAVFVTHYSNLVMLANELLEQEQAQGASWLEFVKNQGSAAVLEFDAPRWRSVEPADTYKIIGPV